MLNSIFSVDLARPNRNASDWLLTDSLGLTHRHRFSTKRFAPSEQDHLTLDSIMYRNSLLEFIVVTQFQRFAIAFRPIIYNTQPLRKIQRTSFQRSTFLSSSRVEMPRGIKKENLPTKVCVVCNRPFTWRKKWERVWNEVTTCSKSCNNKRRQKNRREKETDRGIHVHESGLCLNEEENRETPTRIEFRAVSENLPNTEVQEEGWNSTEFCTEGKNDLEDLQNIMQSLKKFESCTEGNSDMEDQQNIMQSLDKFDVYEESDRDLDEKSDISEESISNEDDPVARRKAERKAAKKLKKLQRRAKRQGLDPESSRKPCNMCGKESDLLIRCTYDASGEWKMICGKCWNVASGGIVDGDKDHPYYRYGGLWKNRARK